MKKILKIIKVMIAIIILILIFAVATLIYKGYNVYKNALNQISISDKVKGIQEKENYTKLDEMPEFYLNAVIAVDDRRFYNHGAVDIVSLARACWVNVKAMEVKEGGSTITQQ